MTTKATGNQYSFPTLEARFWAKVDKGGPLWQGTPCWLWTAWVDRYGYGRFNLSKGVAVAAHRFAYELLGLEIPLGLTLDHLCRNRPCVNPQHMEPVTNRENILRGVGLAALNAAKSCCPKGHPYFVSSDGKRRCRTCHGEVVKRGRTNAR